MKSIKYLLVSIIFLLEILAYPNQHIISKTLGDIGSLISFGLAIWNWSDDKDDDKDEEEDEY